MGLRIEKTRAIISDIPFAYIAIALVKRTAIEVAYIV